MYAIEKNIPVPASRISARNRAVMPFDELEVGESFLVAYSDNPGVTEARLGRNIACRVWAANARYRIKSKHDVVINSNGRKVLKNNDFERKFISKKAEGGVRVWRIL